MRTGQRSRYGEDARAATVIKHTGTTAVVLIQPAQAQGRSRMGARTKCESRIKFDVDGIRINRLAMRRANPQLLAKRHRLEVGHPRTFPGRVSQFRILPLRQWAITCRLATTRQNIVTLLSLGEHRDQLYVLPQQHFTGAGFENRLIVLILIGHRDCAGLEQTLFEFGSSGASDGKRKLRPGLCHYDDSIFSR